MFSLKINKAVAAAAYSPRPMPYINQIHSNLFNWKSLEFFFFLTLTTIKHGNFSPQLNRTNISGTPLLSIIGPPNKLLWDRLKMTPY